MLFINEGLWDEARVFMGNALFNKGIKAPLILKYSAMCKEAVSNSVFKEYKR